MSPGHICQLISRKTDKYGYPSTPMRLAIFLFLIEFLMSEEDKAVWNDLHNIRKSGLKRRNVRTYIRILVNQQARNINLLQRVPLQPNMRARSTIRHE